MPLVARAVRGPSWLAWLSLLFATQIGAADAIAGSEPDDLQDRAAVHAPVCPRPLPLLVGATAAGVGANQDELPAGAAVFALPLTPPQAPAGRVLPEAVRRPHPSTALVGLSPRAPPLSRSL